MTLGELIAELRCEKRWNQKELGAMINKSDSTICNYEKGVHIPDIETIGKIADCFDVSIDYLLQRTSFKYSIKHLTNPLAKDFTLGNLFNVVLELDGVNQTRLLDYVSLLTSKNYVPVGAKKRRY